MDHLSPAVLPASRRRSVFNWNAGVKEAVLPDLRRSELVGTRCIQHQYPRRLDSAGYPTRAKGNLATEGRS